MDKNKKGDQKQLKKTSRPSSYDWFRSSATSTSAPSKKSFDWKTLWKFFKIFVYTFLFSCLATGCVQLFVINTDVQVGKGVEFYNSDDDVSPHVTSFEINGSAEEGYELSINYSDNIWISDEDELEDISEQVATQGFEMSDAYKGVNESFVVSGSGLATEQETPSGQVEHHEDLPIVVSSETLTNENGYSDDYVTTLQASDAYLQVDDVEFLTDLESLGYDISNLLNSAYVDTPAGQYALQFIETITKKETLTIENVVDEETGEEIEKNMTFGDWVIVSLEEKTPEERTYDINLWGYSAPHEGILGYAGIYVDYENFTSLSFVNEATVLYIPGISDGEQAYRPISNWADAWKLGPFYGVFVYPIAYVTNAILSAFPLLNGWEVIISMIITIFLLRLISFALGFKSTMEQTKMQELSGKRATIEAKYAPYKGNKQMENRKKQEMADLYKKEGISPLGSMSSILITTPIFLSIWRVLGGIQQIKSTTWLTIEFNATSWEKLFAGELQYLPLMMFAAVFSAGQTIVPRIMSKRRNKSVMNVHQKEAMRKNNRVQNIMVIVFVFMALIFQASLQIYWIISGFWVIMQNIFQHKYLVWKKEKTKRKKLGVT